MTDQPTKVRYLLLDTSMQYDTEGPSRVAVVPVTQALLDKLTRLIAGMRKWKQAEPDVYETYFWCGLIDYYCYDLLNELDAEPAAGDAAVLSDFDPERYEPQLRSMECHQLLLRLPPGLQDGVALPAEIEWYAIPKHGSFPVTTNTVTLERLQAVFDS